MELDDKLANKPSSETKRFRAASSASTLPGSYSNPSTLWVTASAIPGTLVNLAAGGSAREAVRFGHPSGTLRVGAQAALVDGQWTVTKAIMSRSARILMEGWVRVPGDAL